MRLFFRKRRKVTEKDNVQDKVQKPAEKAKIRTKSKKHQIFQNRQKKFSRRKEV